MKRSSLVILFVLSITASTTHAGEANKTLTAEERIVYANDGSKCINAVNETHLKGAAKKSFLADCVRENQKELAEDPTNKKNKSAVASCEIQHKDLKGTGSWSGEMAKCINQLTVPQEVMNRCEKDHKNLKSAEERKHAMQVCINKPVFASR
jgi:hypothetical protein